jgi:hypothetical protein
MNDERSVDTAAASPFRLRRLHPGFDGVAATLGRFQRTSLATWLKPCFGRGATSGSPADSCQCCIFAATPGVRRSRAVSAQAPVRWMVCHEGIGLLCQRGGAALQGEEHLATAAAMYREMGMTYWLEKAGTETRESAR